jgi:hypothetical protein
MLQLRNGLMTRGKEINQKHASRENGTGKARDAGKGHNLKRVQLDHGKRVFSCVEGAADRTTQAGHLKHFQSQLLHSPA